MSSIEAAPDLPQQRSVEQRVYVDHSESMNGFVGGRRSGERTTFDEFIDAMPDVLPGCRAFRYGQERGQALTGLSDVATEVEFNSQLHNRNFYRLQFNPDDLLLSSLADEQRPVLSVLITDGVESNAEGLVNTRVVGAIRDWMSQGKVFAIFILRSQFSGRYYSERSRTMYPNASLPSRPFYAFVLSPDMTELRDLHEKLLRRFPEMKLIVFSDDAVTARTELPTEVAASYASQQPPSKPYHWQMLMRDKFTQLSDSVPVYRFIYDVKPYYPVKSFGLRVASSIYSWDASKNGFQPEGRPLRNADDESLSDHSEQEANNGIVHHSFSLEMQSVFEGDSESDYSFYSIAHTLYVKELKDEIVALSTRDDLSPATADRTYRFQELVFAILDLHLKERIIPRTSLPLYVTLKN
jgi:hypothetical protein